jgi:hypothetical protein
LELARLKEKQVRKYLVIVGLLAVLVSSSHASILKVWLTADTVMAANVNFNVYVWARVFPDPVHFTNEDISAAGICDLAVTIYSADTTGVVAPVSQSIVRQDRVKTSFSTSFDNLNILPLRRDWTQEPGGADGDWDAVEGMTSTSGADLNVGVGSPVLVLTEVWQFSALTPAYLGCWVPSNCRHWDVNLPSPYKSYFTSYEAVGVEVVPEPSTMAVLAIGASATLLRRRRK